MLKQLRHLFVRLLGASSPLVAGRLVSAAVTFSLPLILARLLTPSAFGTYKQFFLIAVTLQATTQLGLTQSLYYFLPREGSRRGAFVAQAATSLIVLGTISGIAVFFSAPTLARWLSDPDLIVVRLPLALFCALMLIAAPLEGALTSEGRVGTAAVVYVVSDSTRSAALILGVTLFGPAGIFWGAAVTAAARVGAFAVMIWLRLIPFARPRLTAFKSQLAYSLPYAAASYLFVGQRYFSQYAVSASFDAATFAVFAVASFHLPVVDIIFTPLTEVMMVQIGREHRAWHAWNGTVQRLAAILFPLTAAAWVFGPTVLPILFTHKYDGAVPLFIITTLEIPIWIVPFDALMRAVGDTRYLFALNAVRLIVSAACVMLGIKWFGLRGAILGAIVSETAARIAMGWRARRHLGVPFARICDISALSRITVVAAVASSVAWGLRWFIPSTRLWIGAGAFCFCAIYFVGLILWRRNMLGDDLVPSVESAVAKETTFA